MRRQICSYHDTPIFSPVLVFNVSFCRRLLFTEHFWTHFVSYRKIFLFSCFLFITFSHNLFVFFDIYSWLFCLRCPFLFVIIRFSLLVFFFCFGLFCAADIILFPFSFSFYLQLFVVIFGSFFTFCFFYVCFILSSCLIW